MAGLLDQYNPQIDGLGLGLLGASQALLTPRLSGGGVGEAFRAFGGGLLQGEQMQRQRAQDAQRSKLYDAQIANYASDAEYRKGLISAKNAEAQREAALAAQKHERLRAVEQWITQNRPELLPAFNLKPEEVAARLLPPEPEKPYNLRAGERRFDPATNSVIAENPREVTPPAPTELEKLQGLRATLPPGDPRIGEINERIKTLNYRQPPASMSVSYGAPFEGVGADGKPMLYQPGNRGGPPLPTGLAPPPKVGAKPTEDENRSAGLAVRMEDALQTVNAITKKNPGAATPPFVASMVGKVSDVAANAMTPADRQRVEAAQLDALDAALTLATGAAYTKEQLAGLSKSYFPQINDKPETIKDKAARLAKVIETARIRAGTAAPNIDRINKPKPSPAAPGGNVVDFNSLKD